VLAANANWGYAKQPDELRVADLPITDGDGAPGGRASTSGVVPAGTVTVAQAPRLAGLTIMRENTGSGTDDATPDGLLSSPRQPVAGVTVAAAAEAQPRSSSDPSPPSTFHSLPFYLFTNGILQQAEDLRGVVVGDRKEKDLGTQTLWMVRSFADRAASITKQIASAWEVAGATSIEAGVTVADAPPLALDQAKVATRELRNLSTDAKYVAKYMEVDEAGNGTYSLRTRAQSAGRTADTAEHRLATLEEPNPDYPRTAPAILHPVSREAISLAEHTTTLAKRWGNQTAWIEDVEREAARLVKDEEGHAADARWLGRNAAAPRQALNAVKPAADSLRLLADFALQVADDLDSRGKAMRDLAESTAAQADRINAQVFGVAQPTTPRDEPGRPRWQGTELPTPGPDPDTPVMDAGLDPSPDPRTAVAGVEGDGHPAAPNATSPSRPSRFQPASRERRTSPRLATPTPPAAPQARSLPRLRPCARTLRLPRPPTPMRSLARTRPRPRSTTASCSPSWPPTPPSPTPAEVVAAEPSQLSRTGSGTTDRP